MAADKRIQNSKTAIKNGFIELLQEKPFEKITLIEVCKRAGVNRSTFYKYYKDMNDWCRQMRREYGLHVYEALLKLKDDTLEEDMTQFILSIPSDFLLFDSLFYSSSQTCLSSTLLQIHRERNNHPNENDSVTEHWKYLFLICGLYNVIQY